MTVHLVTGHAGKIHVTSAEQAQYNAYVFGDGVYIINGCEATILNDNTVHIGEGTMLVQGRHVNVNSGGDDVTIKNGTAGQRRRDLICLTYTMDTGTGVEECAFTVVEGESGSDFVTPALEQQSILKGDNPCSVALYTVDIETDRTLTNIQKVCELFGNYNDVFNDMRDYVSDFKAEFKPEKYVLKSEFLNKVYPVGSIYISTSSANPGNLFGGTWEQIKDRFLLAAGSTYTAGATGGEASHTLTVSEIPSHSHSYTAPSSTDVGTFQPNNYDGGGIKSANTGATGGGAAHNNMPPYLAVYVWKRTA